MIINPHSHPTALLSDYTLTGNGTYQLKNLDIERAQDLAHRKQGIESAITSPAMARFMSRLLGIVVPVNRLIFVQQQWQIAIVLKSYGPPGSELTQEDFEHGNYELKELIRLA